jgi:hypothetical protein
LEQFSEILIIWSLKKIQSSHITQVRGHFLCNELNFNWNHGLLLHITNWPIYSMKQSRSSIINNSSDSQEIPHLLQKSEVYTTMVHYSLPLDNILCHMNHTLKDCFSVITCS